MDYFFKERRVLITHEEIMARIADLAQVIAHDFDKESPKNITPPFEKCLMLLCVVESARPFTRALEKELQQLGVQTKTRFVKASSYGSGMQSSGQPIYTYEEGVRVEIAGSNVLVVEDMIDTGITLSGLVEQVKQLEPGSLHVAVLLKKIKDSIAIGVDPYIGFVIPDLWVDGFGIDTDNKFRNRRDVRAYLQGKKDEQIWKEYRNNRNNQARPKRNRHPRSGRHRTSANQSRRYLAGPGTYYTG